jgi:predicted dehydrogenase
MAEIVSRDWHEGIDIMFERGSLSLTFASPLTHPPAQVKLIREGHAVTLETAPSWSFRRQVEAFVAAIAGGTEPLVGGRDALEDLGLAEAIWRRELARG